MTVYRACDLSWHNVSGCKVKQIQVYIRPGKLWALLIIVNILNSSDTHGRSSLSSRCGIRSGTIGNGHFGISSHVWPLRNENDAYTNPVAWVERWNNSFCCVFSDIHQGGRSCYCSHWCTFVNHQDNVLGLRDICLYIKWPVHTEMRKTIMLAIHQMSDAGWLQKWYWPKSSIIRCTIRHFESRMYGEDSSFTGKILPS